jgi:hypothetical protein
MGLLMKLSVTLGVLASTVAILSYMGFTPDKAFAEKKTIENEGNSNIQINAEGNVHLGSDVVGRINRSAQNKSCNNNSEVIIKPNTLAAVNSDIHRKMSYALTHDDNRQIEEMIYNGLVVKFDSPQKACVIKKQFSWYISKVQLKSNESSVYWVNDSTLTKVN